MVNEDIFLEMIASKEKRLNIRVSNSFYQRMLKLKKRTGVNYSEMLRRGLTLYLDKHDF